MNILHIVAFAHRGGCEKNCYHFINGSPQFSHEVLVLDQEGPMSIDWQQLGVPLQHLNILKQSLFKFKTELTKYLNGKKYDLVILWSTIRLPIQLAALNLITQQVKVYLGNPLAHNARKDALLNFIYRFKGEVTLMACSDYVANTYKNAAYFKQFAIKTSLNPIALPSHFPEKKIDTSVFKIGMVARLDPIKDHATVIDAFAIASKQINNAHLHFVGDGSLRQTLENNVQEKGLTQHVTFYGDVKNVYDYLNEWDVFVYATTPAEGLGSVVGEAMANGLPCVLSDLPMMRELAPKQGLALFFEAGNAEALAQNIIFLHANDKERHMLSQNAFNHAKINFGAERFVNDYINRIY